MYKIIVFVTDISYSVKLVYSIGDIMSQHSMNSDTNIIYSHRAF